VQLNEMNFTDALPIEGYGPGFFRIGGKVYNSAILVMPTGVEEWQGYDDADSLLAKADEIDVLFIGTGAEIAHIPAHLRTALETAEIGVETMASPSACRTYNVLLSEGRRVAAALLCV